MITSIAQVLVSLCPVLESARIDLLADVLGVEQRENIVNQLADQGEPVTGRVGPHALF